MNWCITHPSMGVYIGHGSTGELHWSVTNPDARDFAVTFPTPEQAESHIGCWSRRPDGLTLVKVDAGEFASVAACVAAGLPGWINETTPCANELPI